ncbi:MAG: hypothetical protein IJ600_12800 [Lachnospiraceae bacterium]|nr:hypothetical protein [Lachnospiraceae bacterium]
MPAAAAVLFFGFLLGSGRLQEKIAWKDRESLFLYGMIMLALVWPLLRSLGVRFGMLKQGAERTYPKTGRAVLFEELALALFVGLVIPLLVLVVSPMDFLVMDKATDPLHYARFSFTVSCGVFLLWGSLIYGMADEKGRWNYGKILFLLQLVGLLDMLFFRAVVGNVSTMLEFEQLPHFELKAKACNLLLIAALLAAGSFFWEKGGRLRDGFAAVLCFSFLAMSVYQAVQTKQGIHEVDEGNTDVEYVVPISKEGRNVIVLMLDRGISAFVPFLFEEKPQLQEQFAGFTYYPNTLSYGRGTGTGAPALYGGYEYATEALEEKEHAGRSSEELHEEALLVMPVLFGENGWKVTVTDPAFWAASATDYSIYDPYPYITAYSLERNVPVGYDLEHMKEARERNFFFYSLYRMAPAMLQDEVYDKGGYLAADHTSFLGEGEFRRGYTVLKNMETLTQIREGSEDLFLSICNNTTHAEALLALPEYSDEREPDYTGIDIAADKYAEGKTLRFDRENVGLSVGHYHSNMAAFLKLGEWFDYLRECGVYDNCRIIIVSDHGYELAQREDMLLSNGVDVEAVNPLLLVKDFGCNAPFAVDEGFMTNADTPLLAAEGLIGTPVNPFTGAVLSSDAKKAGVHFKWQPLEWDFYGDPDAPARWYLIKDDIFDEENWVPMAEP